MRTYPKTKMKEALRSNPAFAEAFTAGLARQLQDLRSRMALRNIRSARERVLQYLRLRAGSQGRRIAIDGQLQDIAAEIGVTREAFYRTLAALCGGVGSALAQAASPGADQPHDMPLPATLETAVFAHFITKQLEGRFGYTNSFRWNAEGWIGTDEDKVWLRSEGRLTNSEFDDGQHELLYSCALSTFFNAQVGGRYDGDSLPGRGWGALGIEGLAPQFFRVAATGYVSGDRHFAAKLEGS